MTKDHVLILGDDLILHCKHLPRNFQCYSKKNDIILLNNALTLEVLRLKNADVLSRFHPPQVVHSSLDLTKQNIKK